MLAVFVTLGVLPNRAHPVNTEPSVKPLLPKKIAALAKIEKTLKIDADWE